MASRKNYIPHIATLPRRQWISRATLFLLVTFGFALMIMGRSGAPAITQLRTSITDALTPVLTVAASPFDAMHNAGMWLSEMTSLRADNISLKNQNLQLMQWQSAAKEMEEENRALRQLLNAVPAKTHTYITARVVSDLGGPYVHSALINGGSENNIHKDHPVINERGLAGRVIDVGESSARVLLLTDINSRVPVMAERVGEKGILVGNNSEQVTMTYLPAGSRIEAGDRLVTSGDGGIFPPGIAVGVVTSVEKGSVTVQPFVDPAKLEYVSIIDYSL